MDLAKLSNNTLATAKICRLCETKDGPFLNIFGPDMNIAKKIENVVFITINEYDDLPHKICFRCSARLEDFQEFVNKCVQTQQNLSKMIGIKFSQKNVETRKIKHSWEAKLNENKISNEEYCDELIKKALEMATDFKSKTQEFDSKLMKQYNIKESEIRLRHVDMVGFPGIEKKDDKYFIKDLKKIPKMIPALKKSKSSMKKKLSNSEIVVNDKDVQNVNSIANHSKANDKSIPDNFTSVRVSGVGLVYTCKKCDSVLIDVNKVHTHKCFNVKNFSKATPPIISTTQQPNEIVTAVKQSSRKPGPARHKLKAERESVDIIDLDPPDAESNSEAFSNVRLTNVQSLNPETRSQSNSFYGYPLPTNLYLVPSGGNTFSLRAGPPINIKESSIPKHVPVSLFSKPESTNVPSNIQPDISISVASNTNGDSSSGTNSKSKSKRSKRDSKQMVDSSANTQEQLTTSQKKTEKPAAAPYPIGLLCRNSATVSSDINNIQSQLKASLLKSKEKDFPQYTILPPKTPGKIVLSAVNKKLDAEKKLQESVPLKKRRKQTFEVLKEPTTPPPPPPAVNQHFFTYINLDNMLAPSSVLPTKTVQEASVSTTVMPSPHPAPNKPTNKTKALILTPKKIETKEEIKEYICSICDLPFSREKKLIAHVRTHYQTYDDD